MNGINRSNYDPCKEYRIMTAIEHKYLSIDEARQWNVEMNFLYGVSLPRPIAEHIVRYGSYRGVFSGLNPDHPKVNTLPWTLFDYFLVEKDCIPKKLIKISEFL